MAATDHLSPEQFGNKEDWPAGSKAQFEYHCYEGHDSSDAQAWYHSHRPVTVLSRARDDEYDNGAENMSFTQRAENGVPATYQVRHKDGYEHTAFEDELMTHTKFHVRPDPPKAPKA